MKIHPQIKKLLLGIAFLMFCVTHSNGQILIALVFGDKLNSDKMSFGLNLGGNVSDMTNLDNSEFDLGLQFGIYIDFKLKEKLTFSTELNAITNIVVGVPSYPIGNPNLDTLLLNKVEVERKLSYGSAAFFFKYHMGKWWLESGPRGSLRFNAEDIFTAKVIDSEDLVFTKDIKDQVTLIDVGWAIGAGRRIFRGNGVYFSIRYYYGFIDVLKDVPGSQHVSSFQFNARIPIVGKKKVEEGLQKLEN